VNDPVSVSGVCFCGVVGCASLRFTHGGVGVGVVALKPGTVCSLSLASSFLPVINLLIDC